MGRHAGGTGRIKNAVTWLNELDPSYAPQIEVKPPTIPPTNRAATKADAIDNAALTAGNFDGWVKWLRPQNIFYSSPLDLDMMMMTAFPAAYVTAPLDPAADKVKLAESVFGEHGKGNAELNTVGLNYTDQELWSYKALFKSSSKPGSHLEAFGNLSKAQLQAGCPEPLKALIERAGYLIAQKPAVKVTA